MEFIREIKKIRLAMLMGQPAGLFTIQKKEK
jgi:hypothetical protein